MKRSLTLLDSGLIDPYTIDRVLQSVVFFSDRVVLRASFAIAGPYRERADEINRRIDELHEAGLLRLWGHEYEVDDSGRLRFGLESGRRRRADLVIPQEQMRASLIRMDEVMRAIREEAYRRSEGDDTGRLRQGAAEIVSLRNQMASLVISSELKQDGLLSNPAVRAQLTRHLGPPGPERFEATVVRDVLGQLRIGPLHLLTVDQILQSRRYNAGFRSLLDESLLAVARGHDPVLTPEATARELTRRYRETIAEFARPQIGGQVAQEVVWDVLGATVPPTVVFKYGLRALTWRKAAQRARPFLLLMHLERSFRGMGRGSQRLT
ncbi:hypothetical protein FHU28_004297 [Micromonospora echinospora]|uniref:Uncharacterized protein n=1 Tax=Micromonospora echinospora TaxID=1877 RepID=A0ABR6MGF2_MICEC|nr:hypothetical protein [Micromonospora echinospora]MBB5114458.1 hypothetical protein [Micromonospora echinospora]